MASTPSPQPARVAVRRSADPAMQREVEEYLAARGGSEVTWFLPKDDDELNSALCEGRYQRVIFADWDAMMEPLWKGEAKIDEWKAGGVEIELVRPPAPDPAAWQATLDETDRSLACWRAGQRRRQTIMACILSVLALASLIVLFLLIPTNG